MYLKLLELVDLHQEGINKMYRSSGFGAYGSRIPKKSTQTLFAEYVSPVIRGRTPVKPLGIELNIKLRTEMSRGSFGGAL